MIKFMSIMMINFGYSLIDIWIDLTVYHTAEINVTAASQSAVFGLLFFYHKAL